MYERPLSLVLRERLNEPPARLLVLTGPRQVGKSTLVRQALVGRPALYVAADQPAIGLGQLASSGLDGARSHRLAGAPPDGDWLVEQWVGARVAAKVPRDGRPFVLAIDEIQKVPRWSEVVKGLWDADRAAGLSMHVILLGSSPWLMRNGLTESLAGRYELLRMNHWSYSEMQEAFDFSLEEYLHFGGYPGSVGLVRDEGRWRDYVRAALVHPSIERDILQMTRVDKPALLKALFELGCAYSGQIISYTKLQGQLQDAGNTVTLAHYLDLLSQAGFVIGIPKYAGQEHRRRAAPPKLNVLNSALVAAHSCYGLVDARNDRSYWGRLVETAVGAHLCNTASDECHVQYWRESPHEVDFVLSGSRRLVAIEVKSASAAGSARGLDAFCASFPKTRRLVVGEGGTSLAEFLTRPADEWLE